MTRRALIAIAFALVAGAALFASHSPVAPDCLQTVERCRR
jgi:hypothetical protein